MLREWEVPAAKLAEAYRVRWRVTPQEYFEFRTPGAFEAERAEVAFEAGQGQWQVELEGDRGTALAFEFAEQVVGWPGFTIEAPAGTRFLWHLSQCTALSAVRTCPLPWH